MAEIAGITGCIEAGKTFLPVRIIGFLIAHTSSLTALIYFNIDVPLRLSRRYHSRFFFFLIQMKDKLQEPEKAFLLFILSMNVFLITQPL